MAVNVTRCHLSDSFTVSFRRVSYQVTQCDAGGRGFATTRCRVEYLFGNSHEAHYFRGGVYTRIFNGLLATYGDIFFYTIGGRYHTRLFHRYRAFFRCVGSNGVHDSRTFTHLRHRRAGAAYSRGGCLLAQFGVYRRHNVRPSYNELRRHPFRHIRVI